MKTIKIFMATIFCVAKMSVVHASVESKEDDDAAPLVVKTYKCWGGCEISFFESEKSSFRPISLYHIRPRKLPYVSTRGEFRIEVSIAGLLGTTVCGHYSQAIGAYVFKEPSWIERPFIELTLADDFDFSVLHEMVHF